MARPSYGDDVKARVKRLFEALLAYVNDEFEDGDRISIDFRWKSEKEIVVKAKRRFLEELTANDKYEGKLTQVQVREALNRLQDFLGILNDHRTATQGSEDNNFTLTLWHSDKEANLRQFEIEWNNRRPPKSKAAAKKTVPVRTTITSPPTHYENLGRQGVRCEQFIGRDEQLKELHNLLQENAQVAITAAVTGMGGVGKTELAIQYARNNPLPSC